MGRESYEPGRLVALTFAFVATLMPKATTAQEATDVGAQALPGYVRARILDAPGRYVAIRVPLTYGWTESIAEAPGPHHRIAGAIGVGARPLPWLGVGMSLAGRGDIHPNEPAGRDVGVSTFGVLEIRLSHALARGMSIGFAAEATTHGRAGSGRWASSTSFDTTGLVEINRRSARATLELGFRRDRSSAATPAGPLSPSDRISLGDSSNDAILVRLSASRRFAIGSIFVEATLDASIGRGRATLAASPSHAVVGFRRRIGLEFALDAFVDLSMSSRPTVPNGPIDPRASFGVAASYQFGGRSSRVVSDEHVESPTSDAQAGAREDAAAEEAPEIRARVVDEHGESIVDAHVVLVVDGDSRETYSDRDGRFVFGALSNATSGALRIEAVGYASSERDFEAISDLRDATFPMRRAESAGVAQGQIRGFDGETPVSTVSVDGSEVAMPVGTDGSFAFTLSTGRHRVTFHADGYVDQTRDVDVAPNAVTIVSVELRRAP